jgi:hypothetical protein
MSFACMPQQPAANPRLNPLHDRGMTGIFQDRRSRRELTEAGALPGLAAG